MKEKMILGNFFFLISRKKLLYLKSKNEIQNMLMMFLLDCLDGLIISNKKKKKNTCKIILQIYYFSKTLQQLEM